ncbi:hypothetical protein GCM10010331_79900 [Streptomyces xanthochromogenes]|uniref:hypothetical protein n=1 Tax=Streptomyces xanthochromogenes TaxID=67384 RepID=UPI0016779FEE|nr:hypothetical protein [Streptomyces xanthochromogenes]GHB80413.1 hypothetical protein GCM10010331_79900 [Streptomyces xanthochromogenes]
MQKIISRKLKSAAIAVSVTVALPVLGLVAASPASAGSCDFGGGSGDKCSSRFQPTQANCDGVMGYLRSHGGNLGKMNNTFQDEWRQCAAKFISFGRG